MQTNVLTADIVANELPMVYFAPDATQGSVTKRIVAFQDEGFDVTAFTFTRDRASVLEPVCESVDLGAVPNEQYARRILHTLLVFPRFLPVRDKLRGSGIYYARLLDMALIAMMLRRIFNPSAKLYYEVCDIRRVFVNEGVKGKVARMLERRLLSSVDCLVVNSPRFVTDYFATVQDYRGRSFLLENKMFIRDLGQLQALRDGLRAAVVEKDRITIAWFGNLDDPWTWAAIQTVARRFPDKVRFYLRGYIILDEAEFRAVLQELPNIIYEGPFNNRTDLAGMYEQVDLVLGLDLMDKDGNSWWLLPNSLYEAGAYCKPLITSKGTATAQRVEERGIGWVLDEPVDQSLADLVAHFDWDRYREVLARLSATDPAEFAGQDQARALAAQIRDEIVS